MLQFKEVDNITLLHMPSRIHDLTAVINVIMRISRKTMQWDSLLCLISVPFLSRKRGTLKLIRPSVCLSVRHKNFNIVHIF